MDKIALTDYQIIDVRTADFIGGNIKSAINIRYDEFIDNIPMIINTYYKTKNVIFDCMYYSLDRYCQSLNALLNDDKEKIDKLLENEHEDFEALRNITLSKEQLQCLEMQNVCFNIVSRI